MLIIAVALVILQQISLALSTLYIARAGSSVATGSPDEAINYVLLFFATALGGFILSSFSAVCAEKSKNETLYRYYRKSENISNSSQLSNIRSMRSKFHNWLVGEAASTIDEFVSFFMMSVNSILNVSLTLIVFSTVFSIEVSLIISLQLLASIVLISMVRKSVSNLGSQLQKQKLESNQYVEIFWNSRFLMSPPMGKQITEDQYAKLSQFFNTRIKYKIWEQSVAAIPIILSVCSLLIYISLFQNWSTMEIGAAVAVLPRTLQLLGNAHTLTIIGTKFFEIRQKLLNLSKFLTAPQDVDLSKFARVDALSVTDLAKGTFIDPSQFLDDLRSGKTDRGRFLITGENGSGKSTFAKRAYLLSTKAILVDPTTNFAPESGENLSTGNLFLGNLKKVLKESPSVLILDEWDANLDKSNTSIIDAKLNDFANDHLVLEIRHRVDQVTQTAAGITN